MQHILSTYHDDEVEAKASMTSLQPVVIDGIPGTDNPHSKENRVVRMLDLIDVLQERYKGAAEYMAWMRPAWLRLTEDERHVLEVFFLHDSLDKEETLQRLCEELGIERSAVYRRKDRAVMQIALLLYGKF